MAEPPPDPRPACLKDLTAALREAGHTADMHGRYCVVTSPARRPGLRFCIACRSRAVFDGAWWFMRGAKPLAPADDLPGAVKAIVDKLFATTP
jgi:hypothetical protein